MPTIKEELWKTLHDLEDHDFKHFKWFLKDDGTLEGFPGIPAARLEKADRQDMVDLIVQTYPGSGALKLTIKVLEKISRNDLVQRLENFSSGPKDGARKEEYEKKKPKLNWLEQFALKAEYDRKTPELKWVQQFAVDVTLDPDTAHPNLIVSGDRRQVNHGDVRRKLPDNPERFYKCVNILGKQSFFSGKSYFEVQVKGKTAWTVGVAKESINRKKKITFSPEDGFWTIWLRNGNEYTANDELPVNISLKSQLKKVGVFVDYDNDLVSFYDVDAADHLYSFTGCSFTEKLYPFFSPCTNNGGINSAPLIMSPVDHPLNLKTHDLSNQKEACIRKKAELMSVQQFAVEVTLDPDTAHPALILSDDRKQVYCSDVRRNLPDNPERFFKCVNVLGKQSFSSGKFYYEVQVKGKTAWTVGVAKGSINRKEDITLSPEDGLWTFGLRNGDEYKALTGPSVCLTLKSQPQKVGVFVDYDNGLVSFYDVDAADHLYSFTDCSFTEKLYPFFSPCTNDGGINSAPLIMSPVNQKKKAELMSVQKFAVEVTLDPDTAHPALFLSDDCKQVHDGDVWKLPDNPKRFKRCVNVLGKQSFSSGRFYYEVQVEGKTAWTVGVAKESINRKKNIKLSPEDGFWTIWLRNGNKYVANDELPVNLALKSHLQKVGVFVNYEEGLVSFYDADTADHLYSYTDCSFTEKLYPFFSPCTHDGGINSAPLIISPLDPPLDLKKHGFDDENEKYERKKSELMRIQQFAVEVTLDPDTAHPALFLSDDCKQVHDGDVWKLPDNPKRFKRCVNVLGKQSFSTGKFYFEVQVKGKTAWTIGVAKESINRKKIITLSPEYGFWTVSLENGDEYEAVDDPIVHLPLKTHPQKVGVFVDYEEGLVSFYDVDAADHLYSFTDCTFTEKLYPFFSPSTKDGGINSAPLVISPINHPLNFKTSRFQTSENSEEHERKKAELMSVQLFAVDVTLDPDTAHPNLILSDDGKQVHHGDMRKNLPDNPERFNTCVNVLGKQSFSSGRFYYEVQVKGKTAWTVGIAKESIDRKGNITLCPKNGFWTLWLRNGDEYEAIDDPSVSLSPKSNPQRVGMFVDYEEGLVSFYDVDTADRLYSFTGCSFTEKVLPYLSPCTNDDGINSTPLIICPVNHDN